MNKLLEKNYKTPDKLYNIDKDTAYWPEDAEDYIYWHSEADKWAENYAKSYKVKMSPKDYLDLTTVEGADNIKLGDNIGGIPTRELDIDELNKETYQNIFLMIAFRNSSDNDIARVVGHEGRHRMFALMQAGVKSVDVELRCDVYDTNYDRHNPFPLKRIFLIGQFNPHKVVVVNNPISMSWKKHKEIRPNLVDEELDIKEDTEYDNKNNSAFLSFIFTHINNKLKNKLDMYNLGYGYSTGRGSITLNYNPVSRSIYFIIPSFIYNLVSYEEKDGISHELDKILFKIDKTEIYKDPLNNDYKVKFLFSRANFGTYSKAYAIVSPSPASVNIDYLNSLLDTPYDLNNLLMLTNSGKLSTSAISRDLEFELHDYIVNEFLPLLNKQLSEDKFLNDMKEKIENIIRRNFDDLIESFENPNLDKYQIYDMLKKEIEGLNRTDSIDHLANIFPEMLRTDTFYLYNCLTSPSNLDTEQMWEWFEQMAEDNNSNTYESGSYLTIDYNEIDLSILNVVKDKEELIEVFHTDDLKNKLIPPDQSLNLKPNHHTVVDGFILKDGSALLLDVHEADAFDSEVINKLKEQLFFSDYLKFIHIKEKPTAEQYKRLEEIINHIHFDRSYVDIKLDNDVFRFFDYSDDFNADNQNNQNIYYGTTKVLFKNKKQDSWTTSEIIDEIKSFYTDSIIENLNEELLLEKTRQELIDKSKKSDNYSKNNQSKGKNRWERRVHSHIANTVRDYNQIDMDAFFKADILDFIIKVRGETDDYSVQITFEEALRQIQDEIKRNKGKLEFKCILRALITAFNRGNVYVSCTCPDWTYRQAYWSTQGRYNSGTPQPDNGKAIANPNDSKGGGCKHVNLVLGNLDWLMKVASVINNYIYWAKDNMEWQYSKYIFPELYGMPYDKAIQMTLDMFDENGNLLPDYEDDTLKSDENIINMANMMGKVRGRYKKKPEQSINPRYSDIHPKKEEPEEETNELGLDLGEEEPEFDMNSEEEIK